MKNFLRALRFVWPYRFRLLLSIACALLAAMLWSLNFTAIYPILKILGSDKSLQAWVDDCIAASSKDIEQQELALEPLQDEAKLVEALPPSPYRDKRLRELNGALVKHETKLSTARTNLYRFQLAKAYVIRYFPADRFQALLWLVTVVVVSVAIKGVFEFWQESLVGSAVNLSLFGLRNRFYRNVIHLDVNHFGEQGTHELMSRFTNDMELLGTGTKTLFGRVIAEPLRAICCVLVAAWISWQLTLMFLILVPIAVFILAKVGRLMKRATRRLLERMSNIYKILQETFLSIRVVKAFTMEPYERRRFNLATKDYYHKAMMVVNLDALASPLIELLGVIAVAGALLAGAYLVLYKETHFWNSLRMTNQPLEAEGLLQLYALLAAIADPVRKLSSVYTRLQSGFAAADRVFEFMDRQPRVRANGLSPRLARHASAIEFRDVCFSYEPERPILTNINLHFGFGEKIALVGKNGCGKTTLVGLLPRFYDPDHGSILLDGRDLRAAQLRSLRRQIGLVTQETILFDDTIYNNIAYGNRQARGEEVEAAARRAFAHDFIVQLGQGYQTRVGEAGSKLSGGQKQRLALARAILRDPSILILDEFTSQCDVESEALIHQALREFMRNRTTFLITHRLSTLEIADRIVLLDRGRIAAVGTHAELIRTCELYQRLHEVNAQRRVA